MKCSSRIIAPANGEARGIPRAVNGVRIEELEVTATAYVKEQEGT
jgi:hypothetical protein